MLVEGLDQLLSSFGPRLSRAAKVDLERLGVEVRTGWTVSGLDEEGVDVRHQDGTVERIQARTKVWAAGMSGSPLARALAEQSGAGVDRMGRVEVLPDCTLRGHPEVFVIGDMMALDDLPGVAEVAIQSGLHAARTIRRRLDGDTGSRRFRYHDLGSLAVVSRFGAVAKIRRLSINGFVGWLLWLVVHLAFLTGFKNRLAALASWTVAFIARGRSERAFTSQQIFARHAITSLRHWVASVPGADERAGLSGLVFAASISPDGPPSPEDLTGRPSAREGGDARPGADRPGGTGTGIGTGTGDGGGTGDGRSSGATGGTVALEHIGRTSSSEGTGHPSS